MKKVFFIVISFILISCQEKEVLLPNATETVVSDVKNHSPVYFFYNIQHNDTLVEVNRKNVISSTNWLFNIDKRLPLRKVILEVKQLQAKKATSVHKNVDSQNYYSYSNSSTKTMAFLPFTEVKYKVEVPDFNVCPIYFDRNDLVKLNDNIFSKNDLQGFIDTLPEDQKRRIVFSFDKKMTFGQYVQNKIFIRNLKLSSTVLKSSKTEYIY